MPCYHPKIRVENLTKWERAKDGHLYHPATIEQVYENDDYKNFKELPNYRKTIIPCRKCIGCRLEYSRQWANRGYMELKNSKENYFITLTYNDENLPENETLVPEHLTKFLHDLRQNMKRHYDHTGIKYLACGEYGEENKRPHYHAILFNCPLPIKTFYNARLSEHNFYWQNNEIEKIWRYGFSNISQASWNNIAYVARYVTKKIYGQEGEEEYKARKQIPEFIRVSKGIGKKYYEENKEEIWKRDKITVKNQNGTIQTTPPKYYSRLLKQENEKLYNEIKQNRIKSEETHLKLKDETHSNTRVEQLEIEERSHIDRHYKLVREFEKNKQ